MKPGLAPEWAEALSASGIRTHFLYRLEFESGTEFLWTGPDAITVVGTGDTLLDNNTFSAIAPGVIVDPGEIAESYAGSRETTLAIAISNPSSEVLAAASNDRDEYQGRLAVIWRAVMFAPPIPGAAATWGFRRRRAGSMDDVRVVNNGAGGVHTFSLTIQAHSAMVSQATGRTYNDQKLIDPGDTSQDYAVAIQNGRPGATGARTLDGLNGQPGGAAGFIGRELGRRIV